MTYGVLYEGGFKNDKVKSKLSLSNLFMNPFSIWRKLVLLD